MGKNKCAYTSLGFMAGTIAGALIGAGLALLYAPKSGAETREDIKKKVDELKKEAKEAKKKAKVKLEKAKKDAAEKADEYKGRAKRAAAELTKTEPEAKKK